MLEALVWGLVSASSLLVGCFVSLWLTPGRRIVGYVMAFGAGVLISAVAYELVEEAVDRGDPASVGLGILAGAVTFFVGDGFLDKAGGERRKSSTAKQVAGAGALAIVLGTALDGVPESLVLGLTLVDGQAGASFLAAVFISNVPEALSATSGLKASGWESGRIWRIWILVIGVSTLATMGGYGFFDDASGSTIAFVQAFAAGAILTMLADTMMPEAFDDAGKVTGLLTTFGFAVAFAMHSL
jgi:ZIP family zinc transporter